MAMETAWQGGYENLPSFLQAGTSVSLPNPGIITCFNHLISSVYVTKENYSLLLERSKWDNEQQGWWAACCRETTSPTVRWGQFFLPAVWQQQGYCTEMLKCERASGSPSCHVYTRRKKTVLSGPCRNGAPGVRPSLGQYSFNSAPACLSPKVLMTTLKKPCRKKRQWENSSLKARAPIFTRDLTVTS